ncbi:MAG TPA: M48 family metallopeptidase, partial [Gemmatimonadales bacterium]|nr:M48 family metallopeptidase [Gemmatimonadales bacterium]
SQTPFVNAGAYGMDHPFIVINSGALNLLDDDEMRVLLGHELGHVMSGHALYHTILVLIVFVGMNFLPFLAGIVLAPIQFALLEWFRKSELSSDRAGLLAAQDPGASMRMFLKMAGGGDMKQMDLDTYLEQAKEYEESGGPIDRVFKILNTLPQSHPFNTLRAAELQRWIQGGTYERVLGGEYTRRGPEAEQRPIEQDVDEAREHYMKEARAVVDDVVDSAKRAAQAFTEAFKKK